MMTERLFTQTDLIGSISSISSISSIDDSVIRLREWGTAFVHMLPEPCPEPCTLGATDRCTIQLHDPSRLVSRLHAYLVKHRGKWIIRDAGSKNGLRADGWLRRAVVLEPGLELRIGGPTLLAESARSIELRRFLAGLLGCNRDRTEDVDLALRSIRAATTRRTALILCGEGDLVPTARSLHHRSSASNRPFIVCDPRRNTGKATMRSADHWTMGMDALAAASGGTLCVRSQQLPLDFGIVVEALRAPGMAVTLVVCVETRELFESYRLSPMPYPLSPVENTSSIRSSTNMLMMR